MWIKTFSILLIFALFSLQSTIHLQAQSNLTKQEKKTEKIKAKIKKLGVGEKTIVRVKLYNDTTYQGYLSESNDDDFVVTDKNKAAHTIKYSDVDSIGGKNLSTGAKIAIGIGIGIGATLLTLYLIWASMD
jgi:hypothetical protein